MEGGKSLVAEGLVEGNEKTGKEATNMKPGRTKYANNYRSKRGKGGKATESPQRYDAVTENIPYKNPGAPNQEGTTIAEAGGIIFGEKKNVRMWNFTIRIGPAGQKTPRRNGRGNQYQVRRDRCLIELAQHK